MYVVQLDDAELDHCRDCNGVWLDAGEQLEKSSAASSLSRMLLYSVTVPERVLRSTVGVAAGAATETASLLVPQAFQSAKTYQLVVKNALGFLARDIGGVKSDGDSEETQDDFVARKAVGNFVDLAGLATLHVSPVWLLAIVSDVAYGTKAYVVELAEELKQQGLIDEQSVINNVDDVLAAIQNASGEAASLFDTPPLSVDQLKKTLNSTKESLASADVTTLLPEAEIKNYWNEMREVANKEHVSLLGVSGAMTMATLSKVSTVSKGVLTGVQVVGGIVNREIIGHYVSSLHIIQQRGLFIVLNETSAPYVEAVWNNFSDDRSTWTEEIVTGRAIKSGLSTITSWFRRKETKDE
jgi:hypothetical protein